MAASSELSETGSALPSVTTSRLILDRLRRVGLENGGSVAKPSRKAVPAVQALQIRSDRNLGKITTPTSQRVFGNARLFERLDAGRVYPVVWIHGPPGAGKTTLAASYLAARGVQPLWCRLDEGDADPASAFLHLALAANLCTPRLSLPLLQPEFRAALPLFARRFFRTLFGPGGVSTMVLDDYHEVAAGAELHDCLPAGLEEVPEGCQVFVISRSAPPSQLARLRLNGRVDVLEPDALRLDAKEIRALAEERGTDATNLAEERLVDVTQGWAAGVILMLEAAAVRPIETCDEPPVPEVLFDYFAGEVLQHMAPWAAAALSTLAILPTMTAATAELLTGRQEAGALLEDLHRRNYFTTRDSAQEPRYRFHPLFRNFLRSRARKQGLNETLVKIRAAALLDEDDQADAAVQLLVETGQTETLATLVKRRAAALVEQGRNDTLISWLTNLDEARIAEDAWLSYWRGMARVGFDPIEAYRHLKTAVDLFERSDNVLGRFVGWIGLSEAVRLDAFGDMSRFDHLIAKMHALLERHPDFPSQAIELAISAAMATALSRRSADRRAFHCWEQRARSSAAAVRAPVHLLRFGFALAIMDLMDGRYEKALQALKSLPDPLSLDHLPLAQWAGLVARGLALAHLQQPGRPEAFATEAVMRLEQSGMTTWMPMLAANVGIMAWVEGDAAKCDAWRSRVAVYSERAGIERGPIYYAVSTGHKIIIGDLAGAKAESEKALQTASKRGWLYFVAQAHLMRAQAHHAAKDFDEAFKVVDRLDEALDASMSDSLLFPAKLLRAELHFERGEEVAGTASLATAMALGCRQGAKCAPALSHAILRRLCSRALGLGIEQDFVRGLIRIGDLRPPEAFEETWPWPIRFVTLGGFSIEIDGAPLVFSRKTPRKLLLLVKAIASYGGRSVPEAKIADALWPDEEADAASNSLTVAIHRLRKLLGDNDAIVVSNGTIGFGPSRCWLDLWAFERKLSRRKPEETREFFEKRIGEGLALYRGDFLPDDDAAWWTNERRDALRSRYRRALTTDFRHDSDP